MHHFSYWYCSLSTKRELFEVSYTYIYIFFFITVIVSYPSTLVQTMQIVFGGVDPRRLLIEIYECGRQLAIPGNLQAA